MPAALFCASTLMKWSDRGSHCEVFIGKDLFCVGLCLCACLCLSVSLFVSSSLCHCLCPSLSVHMIAEIDVAISPPAKHFDVHSIQQATLCDGCGTPSNSDCAVQSAQLLSRIELSSRIAAWLVFWPATVRLLRDSCAHPVSLRWSFYTSPSFLSSDFEFRMLVDGFGTGLE